VFIARVRTDDTREEDSGVMSERQKLSFSHVGVFVHDLQKMVDFYTRVLGLVISDRAVRDDGNEIVFMTLDPREHHQVVFASGRPADLPYNMIQQLSFRAESLSSLRDIYAALKREPIVELGPISHGNAISAYFRDPEGNRLEVFVDTKWHVPQPCAAPVDLTKPQDEIMAFVDRQIAALPGVRARADWESERAAQF
jgi:catechol 2,3-dioxygenase-like lactoylglutathione lyase family enzyme